MFIVSTCVHNHSLISYISPPDILSGQLWKVDEVPSTMISLPITVGWAFSFSLTFLVVVVALIVIHLLPVDCYLVAWCLVVL